MSEQEKLDVWQPYKDESWYWVKYSGSFGTIEAPAMFKANCDSWYSWRFSGVPTCQVEILGPCARASLPVGVPDGWALVPVEPTPKMIDAHGVDCGPRTAMKTWKAMLAAAPAAPEVSHDS